MPNNVNHLKSVSNKLISSKWDIAAAKRFRQLRAQEDMSYQLILSPLFENYCKNSSPERLLDAGCGVGFITKSCSFYSKHVVGVDISSKSIDIAQSYNMESNVSYYHSAMENFEADKPFDTIISNMALMDCANLYEFLAGCKKNLKPAGRLIASIVNPLFWPRYWGYERFAWFNYNKEIHIEAPFQTSSTGKERFSTIHTHRPISSYLKLFSKLNFTLVNIEEISGYTREKNIHSKYPRYIVFHLSN